MAKLPRTRVTATSRKGILQWLDSPEVDAAFLRDDLKFSLLLLDQYDAGVERILAERAELGELSWLGGPALSPMEQWPRNADGEPLAHIATIQLGEAQALIESPDFTEPDWPEPTARFRKLATLRYSITWAPMETLKTKTPVDGSFVMCR